VCGELIEQVVLSAIELVDGGQQVCTVLAHRLGVTGGLTVLGVGKRRLADHRSQRGVRFVIGELFELLVDQRQLGSGFTQARADLAQFAFDHPAAHRSTSVGNRATMDE
jgi:hypothetical protein